MLVAEEEPTLKVAHGAQVTDLSAVAHDDGRGAFSQGDEGAWTGLQPRIRQARPDHFPLRRDPHHHVRLAEVALVACRREVLEDREAASRDRNAVVDVQRDVVALRAPPAVHATVAVTVQHLETKPGWDRLSAPVPRSAEEIALMFLHRSGSA